MTAPPDEGEGRFILPGGLVDEAALRAFFASAGDGERPTVRFELQRDLRARLDKYIVGRIAFMSRTHVQRLIDEGDVRVNGQPAKPSTKLRLGDVVEVSPPPPPSGEIEPERIDLSVLLEDEHIVVLNKQPGIIVHPARSENTGTLIHALAWHFANVSGGSLSTVGTEHARPGVVHRLDRHTTGCIVFAKTEEAHWKLGRQFEHRSVNKRYLAVVHGRVEPDVHVIDMPLGPHQSRAKGAREKQVVRFDEVGKPSVTVCRVRERYRLHHRSVGDQHFTLVELELKTGRTHQIRVHMAHQGWPLVGDDLYGGRAFVAPGDASVLREGAGETIIDRQALHAALLAFEHPVSGEPVECVAPIPADLVRLIDCLRAADSPEPIESEGLVSAARLGLA